MQVVGGLVPIIGKKQFEDALQIRKSSQSHDGIGLHP